MNRIYMNRQFIYGSFTWAIGVLSFSVFWALSGTCYSHNISVDAYHNVKEDSKAPDHLWHSWI